MTVSNVPSSGVDYSQLTGQRSEFRQQFKQLTQDIQSGNLQAAQNYYAALSKLQPNLTSSSQGSSGTSNPYSQLMSQIGSTLQSGDISGAQQALAQFEQQKQTSQPSTANDGAAGGHHHHHAQPQDTDGDSPASSSSNPIGSVSTTA